jgi:hypothetical protein
MILSREQVLCYFIFILCISLITFYYIRNGTGKNKIFENFVNPTVNPTNNPSNNPTNNNLSPFNDTEISNMSAKNSVNDRLPTLSSIFDKYSTLDPAITVNNDGFICDSWGNYNVNANTTNTMNTPISNNNNNQYNSSLNSCKIINSSNSPVPQCLSNNNLTSCSSFFSDGYINKLTSIDINTLQKNTRSKIIRNTVQLIKSLEKQNREIDLILDILLDKLKLEDQQLYFIKYNTGNLDDKTRLVNKTKEEYEKNENSINVNQINFSNFLSKNNNNITKINFYYNIIIGLIITIIVVGIINFFMSEIS